MRRLIIFFYCIVLVLSSLNGYGQQAPSLRIFVFHAEECDSCESALQGYLSMLRSTYSFLEIEILDVRNPSVREFLGALEKKSGRKGDDLPVVFVEDHILSGEREIMDKLELYILEYQIRKGLTQPPLGFPGSTKSP